MNHKQKGIIKTVFTHEKNPCSKIKFNECEELYKKYKRAVNAPGCSACAQRRARNKYGEIVMQKVQKLDYDTVYPTNPQKQSKVNPFE